MRRPKRSLVVKTRDGIEQVFEKLQEGPLAIDTETTGLKWWVDRVGSIQVASGTTAAFFYGETLGVAAKWLAEQVKRKRELVLHNAKFDMHMLRATFGIHVPYPVHDTSVQSFLLDSRGVWAYNVKTKTPHNLKMLASIFVDPDALDAEPLMLKAIRARGGRGSEKGDWMVLMGTEDEHLVTDYGTMDPWYTLQLHQQFIERLRHWPQPDGYPPLTELYETERWMILALRDMEERGIMVHADFLNDWRIELGGEDGQGGKLGKIRRKLRKIAGREINWNSQPQLVNLLFTKRKYGGLGIVPERVNEEGKPTTDEVALRTMKHPIGLAMVEYRETYKQWSSYAVSLLNAIAPDGAIHATFRSTGARTGRTSCAEPNLQQQTRESGVRKAYHPRKGLVFRFADYSQVEMRFAAHLADEPTLIKGFNEDPDFDTHRATAQVMYGIAEPNARQRKFGKILNFTTLFGGGVKKVAEQLQERLDLADVMQALKEMRYYLEPGEPPHLALAGQLKERYNDAMPNIRKATRAWADLAEERTFVMNVFGRHRYIQFHKWYTAFNTDVQGTAGDQAKRGLVAVYRERQLKRGDVACLLLIHDEIVFESEGDKRTDRRVLELMQDTESYKVPIIATMSGSKTNWHDKKEIKL